MKQFAIGWLCIGVLALLGCAGNRPASPAVPTSPVRDAAAADFFVELDRLIEIYGVRDASSFRVAGFPYLRADRFLLALSDRLDGRDQKRQWIEHMRQMDLSSREKEIANLPFSALAVLAGDTGGADIRAYLLEKVRVDGRRLLSDDRRHPDFVDSVAQSMQVPDEYSTLMRWVGLYPLAGIPVTVATAMANRRYREWHQTPPGELPLQGRIEHFTPPPVDRGDVARLLRDRYAPEHRDSFGLPLMDQTQLQRLARGFAPVITQDVTADYDRFGRVSWRADRVFIHVNQPTVYFYPSYSFFNGSPVLQLNYAVWFTERAGDAAPWFEKGPLDGLTFRVTLGSDGAPVMIDIMNNCGCYHFFVPSKDRVRGISPRPGELEPLVPAWMPHDFPRQPVHLRLSSGWHQVQHIQAGKAPTISTTYELVPYRTLESLPKENGRHESVFSPDGIMKDSWRIEPYIFFSMGVPKVGYMRQRGHHAVKLLDRGHFTEPFLFDGIFVYQP